MPRSRESPSMWVFGYGSLIWNPGFHYSDSKKAYALGWVRRMYQGNTYHRGDEKLPGRVATMIEQEKSLTSGVIFRLEGRRQIALALEHLKQREIDNGYVFRMIPVEVENSIIVNALTCVADVKNEFYLGPDEPKEMARQIVNARGCAGPNCEYVLKLAEHVRKLFPNDEDDHLYELERHVLTQKS